MNYSQRKKITIDGLELVFSETLFCKKDGLISIEIEGVKIELVFDYTGSNDSVTKIEVPDNKSLKITCTNYTQTIPDEQGIVIKNKVFNKGSSDYYLQFSSSIYADSVDIRRTTISITKEIEED